MLGSGQIDGRNIPRQNGEMLKWTAMAAERGFPVAQNNLGALYQDGIAVKMDFHKAQHYFKLASDQGYLAAQINLLKVNALLTGKYDPDQLGKVLKSVQEQYTQQVK